MNKYKGTFILVSHDRYFISKTANKIWYIEDKKIKEFVGTYDEYVVFEQEREKRKQQKAAAPVVQEEKPKEKNNPKQHHEDRELKKEHQRKQKKFQRIEEEVNKMQEEKTQLEAKLADPEFYADKDKFQKLDETYKAHTDKLDVLMKDYDKLFEELLEMEERMD